MNTFSESTNLTQSFELKTHTQQKMLVMALGLLLTGFLPAGLVLLLAFKGIFSTTSMIVLLVGFPCLLLSLMGSQVIMSLRKGHQLRVSEQTIHWKSSLFSLTIPFTDINLIKSSEQKLILTQALSFKNTILPWDLKLSYIPLHWFQDSQPVLAFVQTASKNSESAT